MSQNKIILLKTLLQYIHKKDVKKIRHLFERFHIIDLAALVNQIDHPEDILFIFRTCNSDHTAELFSHLTPTQQENLLKIFTDKQLIDLLKNSAQDDIADFLSDMPANLVSRILRVADPSVRSEINTLLNYKPGTAGSVMTTEYITIHENATIGEALSKIRKVGRDKETIYSNFVVDETRILKGILYIEDVVFSEAEHRVADVMNKEFISCYVHTDQEEVSNLFKRYDLSVIPVLNESNHLVGIITIDDIVDVIDKEASEDILKLAKVIPIEESYQQASVKTIAKKSIPWLILLLILGALSGFILNQFESAFEQVAILAAFIPMLMDTGGNAGGQSATLVIRAIALNEVKLTDFMKVLKKESKVSFIVGLVVGIFAFGWLTMLMAIGFLKFETIYQPWTWAWIIEISRVSGVVSITLFIAVMIAKMVGSILPLVAVYFKKDPAVMASPFVTTIVDVSALTIYFLLANYLFQLF